MGKNWQDEDLRSHLREVLAYEHFANSPRATAFLSYIVSETLAGREQQLKAYMIGVDALKRPPTFDAQTDDTVQVLARRVRVGLSTYYATDGKLDGIRIEIPKGSYVPDIVVQMATGENGAQCVAQNLAPNKETFLINNENRGNPCLLRLVKTYLR